MAYITLIGGWLCDHPGSFYDLTIRGWLCDHSGSFYVSRVGFILPASCKPHFRDFIFVGWGSGTKAFKGIGRGWTRWLVALPWHQHINKGYLCTVFIHMYSVIITNSQWLITAASRCQIKWESLNTGLIKPCVTVNNIPIILIYISNWYQALPEPFNIQYLMKQCLSL